jgi:hypothetical protein
MGTVSPHLDYQLGSWAYTPLQNNQDSTRSHFPSSHITIYPVKSCFTLPSFYPCCTHSMEVLQSTLTALSAQLLSIENRLSALESGKPARVAVATAAAVSTPPTRKKGKAKAAPPPPPKPLAKERPTKKSPTAPSDLPLHLAQTFPQEDKPDRHLMTVAIPNASAAHVVGQGGQGLKQIHNISGARVAAFTLASGPRDERLISIRGTDVQIGDALVVLGKRLARKRVCYPTVKSKFSSTVAPPPSKAAAATVPPSRGWGDNTASSFNFPAPSTSRNLGQPPGAATLQFSMAPPVATPMSRSTSSTCAGLESLQPPPVPTVVMGSPSPSSTPISVQMGSPSCIQSPGELSPMQVDALLVDYPNPPTDFGPWQLVAFHVVQQNFDSVVPARIAHLSVPPTPGPQTARRGRGRGACRGT